MKFKEWRAKSGESQVNIAKSLSVSQQVVSLWESGLKRPTFERMIEIEALTKGRVKLDDWR